ncbi:hypothetical protein PRZ48_007842 [Zasmidium cellare]|uniref:RNase III domain-containing protein n=1 Tax=Zasmidium cellare TaxID=395010 RepID=A0ABR0EL81_ZASCE|nr:hypothetical protein PRZ48_007842 [Zasmidium cellare]
MSDHKRAYVFDGQDSDGRPAKRQHQEYGRTYGDRRPSPPRTSHDDDKRANGRSDHGRTAYDDRKVQGRGGYEDRKAKGLDTYYGEGYIDHSKQAKKQKQKDSPAEPVKVPLPAVLPPLPTVTEEYSDAPFTHRSVTSESRSIADGKALSYERLEFLGDAYIELFASRLIFSRFPHLPTGQMSQLRELFVKNDTLAEYSRAYGFDGRINAVNLGRMQADSRKTNKPNKGYNKVLGDVFEAYVCAVVLSHRDQGFSIAEQWLYALWEPNLSEAIKQDKNYEASSAMPENGIIDPRTQYDPDAKVLLQKRIMSGAGKKLTYEPYKDPVELKGNQLGQSRHFIALYLTGYGYEKKFLGKGEGKNKVEAGNWAAMEAMYGDAKDLVDECEAISKTEKEKRLAERKAAEREDKDMGKEAGGEVKVE